MYTCILRSVYWNYARLIIMTIFSPKQIKINNKTFFSKTNFKEDNQTPQIQCPNFVNFTKVKVSASIYSLSGPFLLHCDMARKEIVYFKDFSNRSTLAPHTGL